MSFITFHPVRPIGHRIEHADRHGPILLANRRVSELEVLPPGRDRIIDSLREVWLSLSKHWLNQDARCENPTQLPLSSGCAEIGKQRERADICSYLFSLCERCQTEYLTECGITCFFDVDSGMTPAHLCRAVGRVVETLIAQISAGAPRGTCNGAVTVALRRRDVGWVLGVSDSRVGTKGGGSLQRPAEAMQRLAADIQAGWVTRSTPDGSITVVFFASGTGRNAIERRFGN
jgi:hypothetical protein